MSFRRVSAQHFAEIAYAILREISRLKICVRGVNAKNGFFLWLICNFRNGLGISCFVAFCTAAFVNSDTIVLNFKCISYFFVWSWGSHFQDSVLDLLTRISPLKSMFSLYNNHSKKFKVALSHLHIFNILTLLS